ncbi:hypothetical protein CHISP_1364 [Chitinispirillum alkaliphilum]|nr:hypothetical protein CHISP_1364 [Chitinispirillum alkaliphilum]
MTFFRRLLFFSVMILLSHGLFVCSWSDEIRYAGEMSYLPVGAAISAMGDAGVALPGRAVSSHWNPAASSMSSDFEISAEYANLFWGLSHHGVFAFAAPIQNSMGFSGLWIPYYSGMITKWDTLSGTYLERLHDPNLRPDGSGVGYLYNTHQMIVLSLSRLFPLSMPRAAASGLPRSADFAAGINFRGLWQTMHLDDKVRLGMNATFDIGMLVRFGIDYDFARKIVSRQLTLGFSWRNIVPSQITWTHSDDGSGKREYREPVHGVQMYGITYTDKSGIAGANWVISGAIQNGYSLTYHIGLEGEFWETVSFRAGLSDKVPTMGAGIRYRNYHLDYAFRFDQLDHSPLRLSFGVKF